LCNSNIVFYREIFLIYRSFSTTY